MALLNGRDLFVRRPDCHSLWVAPAEAILAKTAEELQLNPGGHVEEPKTGASTEAYLVFQKRTQRRAIAYVQHVGEVEAASATQAMAAAIAKYNHGHPFVWWVCPERMVTRSQEKDIESMFAPAREKVYRKPNQYRTLSMMQAIMRSDRQSPEEGE
jgi:ring-1,2-phenylacetyl-CoA epoxidase subunit PaaB